MLNTDFYTDDYFMKEALKEAQKAYDKDEVPVGAVVVCNKQIISRAHNLTETLNDATAHAEMQAITAASNFLGAKYLKDCTLYVTVEPCVMCASATYWAQIGKIIYGTNDDKRGYSVFNKNILHPKTKIKSGILKENCSDLITSFFYNIRK
ncbi:MAG: nucleoside deaminase [Chlorobi bacterium]|nr:nucleoside deaminase [Chlorobiota bacterium]